MIPPRVTRSIKDKTPVKSPAAFDLWLQRGLHQIYGDVMKEPIPEVLRKLIEEDRKNRQK